VGSLHVDAPHLFWCNLCFGLTCQFNSPRAYLFSEVK
jgi:hypothetical protein